MTETTKACPFCGSGEISDGEVLSEKPDGNQVTQSKCMACGALGPEAHTNGPDYGSTLSRAFWNLRAPVQASEARGDWVLVPREPTEAMCAAGKLSMQCPSFTSDFDRSVRAYRAMLAAAPVSAHTQAGPVG